MNTEKPATPQLGTCIYRWHGFGTHYKVDGFCVEFVPVENAAQEKPEVCPRCGSTARNTIGSTLCGHPDWRHPWHDAVADAQKESVPAMPFTNGWDRYWDSLDKDSQDKLAYSGGLDAAKAWFVIGAVWGKAAPTDRTDATKESAMQDSPVSEQKREEVRKFNKMAYQEATPTPDMLNGDPLFEAIWNTIKSWDVNVPGAYGGYCGCNGNHVSMIYHAVRQSGSRSEGASAPQPDLLKSAYNMIAFLQSVVLCGESLNEQDRAEIKAVLQKLGRASAPQSVQPDRKDKL